jgi:hypothetical protein
MPGRPINRPIGKITVVLATERRGLTEFIELPAAIYRDDPVWVRPLWALEKREYRRGANVVPSRSAYALLLVRPTGCEGDPQY